MTPQTYTEMRWECEAMNHIAEKCHFAGFDFAARWSNPMIGPREYLLEETAWEEGVPLAELQAAERPEDIPTLVEQARIRRMSLAEWERHLSGLMQWSEEEKPAAASPAVATAAPADALWVGLAAWAVIVLMASLLLGLAAWALLH